MTGRRIPGLGAVLIASGYVVFVTFANVLELTPYGHLPDLTHMLLMLIVPPAFVIAGAVVGRTSRLLLIPVVPLMMYGYALWWIDIDQFVLELFRRSPT